MIIPKFLEDLSVISKLGDNPGSDNDLTPNALKAKFDEAALKLQQYINNILVEKLNSLFSLDAPAHGGMNMTGPINMNQMPLSDLKMPIDNTDAASMVAAITDWIMVLIAQYVPIGIQWPGLILPLVLAWYIITELGSILENAVKMGANVPAWLVKLLKSSANIVASAGDMAADSDKSHTGDSICNEPY